MIIKWWFFGLNADCGIDHCSDCSVDETGTPFCVQCEKGYITDGHGKCGEGIHDIKVNTEKI